MSGRGLTQDAVDEAKDAATFDGFAVIEPEPRRLLLDLDTDDDVATFEHAMRVRPDLRWIERWRSKSGKGWHVVVALPTALSAADRAVLQWACGSDCVREYLALARIDHGVEEPSCLFRPPNAVIETEGAFR